MKITFSEMKNEYDKHYGNASAIENFLPEHLAVKKESIIVNKKLKYENKNISPHFRAFLFSRFLPDKRIYLPQ